MGLLENISVEVVFVPFGYGLFDEVCFLVDFKRFMALVDFLELFLLSRVSLQNEKVADFIAILMVTVVVS